MADKCEMCGSPALEFEAKMPTSNPPNSAFELCFWECEANGDFGRERVVCPACMLSTLDLYRAFIIHQRDTAFRGAISKRK